MENRNGLIAGPVTTRSSGHAERLAAVVLIEPHADRPQPITLAADKGYDRLEFVTELREKAVTRMSRKTPAGLSNRWPHHPPRKPSGGLRRGRSAQDGHRGLPKVDSQFTLAIAAYDLAP